MDHGLTRLPALRLDSGASLAPALLAWSRFGPPPDQARATMLLLHGISGSQQALRQAGVDAFPDAGWASPWLGPGKALDTDTCCVLVPNALGSCFGSSAPQGPRAAEFPAITIADTVRQQGLWLRELGVTRLDAVLGYSYGGYQAFEWAAAPALPVDRVVVLASSPRGNGSAEDVARLRKLAADIDASVPGAAASWTAMRVDTLKRYGYEDWLRGQGLPDPLATLHEEAQAWARHYPPWSMATLRQAASRYDARAALLSCSMPLHWLRCASDTLFAPMDARSGADAPYPPNIRQETIPGRCGHLSPVLEGGLWEPRLRSALDRAGR